MRGRWLLVFAVLGSVREARSEDKAAAEILFDEGRKLIKEGKLAEACPKLAESNRLDPGVGTLMYLGECYERSGKLASAWATWREATAMAEQANQAQRAKVAREHASKLESKLIRVQIEVPTTSDKPSLSISRNGAPLARPLWGSAIPVDPGPVEVIASAPGFAPWKTTLQASTVGTLVLSVPPLAAEPTAPAASAPASAAPTAPATTTAPATAAPSTSQPGAPLAPASDPGATRKTAALVAGGVGLLGVGLGSYFGLKAMSTWDDAKGRCTGNVCDGEANRLSKDASTAGTLSTVFFAVGAVGLGAGAGLWLTAPSAPAEQATRLVPTVAPGLAFFSLNRSF